MSDNSPTEQNPYHTGLTPPPLPYPGASTPPSSNEYPAPQPPVHAPGEYVAQTYPTYPTAGTDVTAAAAAHGYAPPPSAHTAHVMPAYGSAPFDQQPMHYGYAPPRPSSGLAVTSLITGIAAIVLIWFVVGVPAAVAAVVTGHMALKRMKAQPELGGRGLAIAGLILGYATLGLAVLLGLFFLLIFGSIAAFS